MAPLPEFVFFIGAEWLRLSSSRGVLASLSDVVRRRVECGYFEGYAYFHTYLAAAAVFKRVVLGWFVEPLQSRYIRSPEADQEARFGSWTFLKLVVGVRDHTEMFAEYFPGPFRLPPLRLPLGRRGGRQGSAALALQMIKESEVARAEAQAYLDRFDGERAEAA